MTLGELIKALERKGAEESVRIGFVHFKPDLTIRSYRGDYSQLAIGYKDGGDCKVGELVAVLKEAVGKEFTGYKGGEYTMDEDTPVYIANSGESGGTYIADVRNDGWVVTLEVECES